MTPTLIGRWQTRLFLMGTIGVLVTLYFAMRFNDFRTPYTLLGVALVIGLLCDLVYAVLQRRRWNRDWSPLLFSVGGLVEFAILMLLLRLGVLDALLSVSQNVPFANIATHYAAVWMATFLFMLGPIRILFPRWRYNGARITR